MNCADWNTKPEFALPKARFPGRRRESCRSYLVYSLPANFGLEIKRLAASMGSIQKKSKTWSPSNSIYARLSQYNENYAQMELKDPGLPSCRETLWTLASGMIFLTIVLDMLFKVRNGTSADLYDAWRKKRRINRIMEKYINYLDSFRQTIYDLGIFRLF